MSVNVVAATVLAACLSVNVQGLRLLNVTSDKVHADKTALPPSVVLAGSSAQSANASDAAWRTAVNASADAEWLLSADASVNASAWQAQAEADLMTPRMSLPEQRLYKKYLQTATNYFEFGAGGSTLWAAQEKNLKHIHTVESDASWVRTVKRKNAVAAAIKEGRMKIERVDIGPTGAWGKPIGRMHSNLWHKYSDGISSASEAQWDLIFVDGRFRVSCFLKGLIKAPGATIMVHDYKFREEYHVLERFARKIDWADTLVVFQRREDADMPRLRWWAEHSETDLA